jgi:hypothetical protein
MASVTDVLLQKDFDLLYSLVELDGHLYNALLPIANSDLAGDVDHIRYVQRATKRKYGQLMERLERLADLSDPAEYLPGNWDETGGAAHHLYMAYLGLMGLVECWDDADSRREEAQDIIGEHLAWYNATEDDLVLVPVLDAMELIYQPRFSRQP